jgi:hypothetical protein
MAAATIRFAATTADRICVPSQPTITRHEALHARHTSAIAASTRCTGYTWCTQRFPSEQEARVMSLLIAHPYPLCGSEGQAHAGLPTSNPVRSGVRYTLRTVNVNHAGAMGIICLDIECYLLVINCTRVLRQACTHMH